MKPPNPFALTSLFVFHQDIRMIRCACVMSQELFGQIPMPKYVEGFLGGQDEALSRLRRIHLCGSENVRKRCLVHVLDHDFRVMMLWLRGLGTPRSTGT